MRIFCDRFAIISRGDLLGVKKKEVKWSRLPANRANKNKGLVFAKEYENAEKEIQRKNARLPVKNNVPVLLPPARPQTEDNKTTITTDIISAILTHLFSFNLPAQKLPRYTTFEIMQSLFNFLTLLASQEVAEKKRKCQ